jgi:hypothetical protein
MSSTLTDRIDGVTTSTAIKAPCRVATTANITLSGEQTVDGIAVVDGDRVLVKDQDTQTENGIYVASTGGWSRALDFDGNRDVRKGTQVLVNSGTVGGAAQFICTATDPIVIDTTNITWTTLELLLDAAPVNSPTFTGVPAAPTAAPGTNTTQISTTAFVKAAIDVILGGVSASFDTLAELASGKAATSQVWEISGLILSPTDSDYKVKLKLGYGFTITSTTTISASGTCTATFKINTTALGGTANAVSSSEQSQAHASNNVAVAGDDLVITVSANSSCAKLAFTISGTRTLA